MGTNTLWLPFKRRMSVGWRVEFGRRLHIGLLTKVSSARKLTIGDGVYIGKFCTISGNGSIGDGVLIGNRVGVGIARPYLFETIDSPMRGSPRTVQGAVAGKEEEGEINIGCDVWVGFGAIIMSGVSVGRGAVIAAGSVVVEDVGPYEIVKGNPAKSAGRRFSDVEKDAHEATLAVGRKFANIE